MTVIVTGSSGFLGGHLVKRLQREGVEIIALGHDVLSDGNELRMIFRNYKPQIVYNLQAYGNHNTQDDDYEALKSNIIYTHNLAVIAREMGVACFMQFGSSSEYGKKDQAMHENDMVEPTTMYGATKAAATLIVQTFNSKTFRVVVIRPFSVYGPGEADFRFIPTIVRKIAMQEPLSLDSQASHDWIYIDDFIEGVMVLSTNIVGGIYNIGTGIQYTNRQIYMFITKILKAKTKTIETHHMRPHDTSTWVADIGRLKSIGWEPKFDIYKGLQHTVAHYNSI